MKLSKRRGKDGAWSYFVRWREGAQHRCLTFKNCPDDKTVQARFADFQLRRARGELGLPTRENLTLAECLEDFLEHKADSCVERHLVSLRHYKKELLACFGPAQLVKSLTEKHVGEYKRRLRADGCAPPTINKKVGFLKAALARAVRNGEIPRNPIENLQKVSDPRPPKWCFLSEEEIDRLLAVLREGVEVEIKPANRAAYKTRLQGPKGLYPLVVFLLNTGARLGEALALRWSDVDKASGKIRLNTTKRAAKGRSARARYIDMNQAVRETLDALDPGSETVFRLSNVERKFRRAVELSGISHCRIHDLRHTFASHLAKAGVPLFTIKELLGHSTIDMTLRYAHLSPAATLEAVQTLNFGAAEKAIKVIAVGAAREAS